mmetsp:Transcript_19607/g.54505  ORF Transcript_19607/g.54505 Transcript_19607/m.54505 type:complete len:625 (-) Transcript_19607:134-2008(-)|eukprot:CAMPEP_0117663622 /NCGR_PEP_ID=MMETSP0804-20121206/8726_1 /TAXON_ID=1074897 /ORGANISM="Tetraselmis astigmatica, Strain CCMP880" /LENGTH=624 /DNA_ID=CAMNT_0005470683 /DNA_START=395 /DNA_END=2269 /DNA_ORIENTATION=+
MPASATTCPVFEVTRDDFRRPFAKWVAEKFQKKPGMAIFKVIPPKGWSPRMDSPSLEELGDIEIQTPIRQHAFGTRGTYRCLLVEQKPLKVSEFKAISDSEEHQPPKKGHEDDTLLERAFWSSITINPPLYGADNPASLFDKKVRVGWNLRDLGDLLQSPGLPPIPGVTTPMLYFGMWKSFFSWHTEDCDLYSINYLHLGAPKVWYCVSPDDREKFEAMARKEFPELYKHCKGFLRHKDVMFSPSMLRTHNVPYVQVRQEPGEFMVLNAGAYHAGFNMGFNCAEAINFACPDWLPIGRRATPCKCSAMKDAVRIDMRFFIPDMTDSESESEEEYLSSSESEDEDMEPEPPVRRKPGSKNKRVTAVRPKKPLVKANPSKRSVDGAPRKVGRPRKAVASPAKKPPSNLKKAALKVSHKGSGVQKAARGRPAGSLTAVLHATRKKTVLPGFLAQAIQKQQLEAEATAKPPRRLTATAAKASGRRSLRSTVHLPEPEDDLDKVLKRQKSSHSKLQQLQHAQGQLVAILGEGKGGEQDKFFHICMQLPADKPGGGSYRGWKPAKEGEVNLLWLKECSDGLFRPSNTVWQERADSLVKVRSQFIRGGRHGSNGYKLLTLRSRILSTELVD